VPVDLSPDALVAHHDRMCRAALELCASPQDADDLVQETYLRLLGKRRGLNAAGADRGYVLRALRNTHITNVRKRQTRAATSELRTDCPDTLVPSSASPATVVFAREIVREIARLPVEQRRTVAAVDLMGLTYGEAARALGTPVGTVMSRLYRGRERLVAALAA
jgi:RNA polymerase sigma-70 factor (ECF subfamily)